ncbi:hypothetical protein D3C78_1960970 [compost metagenome]
MAGRELEHDGRLSVYTVAVIIYSDIALATVLFTVPAPAFVPPACLAQSLGNLHYG